ncbi:MAG TPA: DUF2459 domain-containing protein [Steroidobacteraceae bacterium]|nr:DUF2459 domain-containing protein [Steroidobacteraceae bacterium]
MRPDGSITRPSKTRAARRNDARRIGPTLGMLLAVLQLAVSGCAADSHPHPDRVAWSHAHAPSLFVVKRGWHLDIGFPVAALTAPLRPVEQALPGERYLLFGFGDRRYLTARSKRLDALIAALRPGPALLLLTGLHDAPEQAFGAGSVRALRIGPRQMQAIQSFVWQSLTHADGGPVRVQPGPYPDSIYFAAVPRYSGLHTCNSWAAEALQAAGLPAHRRGVIFAWQLWVQLPRLQRVVR